MHIQNRSNTGRVRLDWVAGGLALGLVFLLAVILVKPIGVSTQFVILNGILWDTVNPDVVVESTDTKSGYTSSNAYLAKSGGKYAKHVENPLNYSFVFVMAIVAGAALSAFLRGGVSREARSMPSIWRENYGDATWKRHLVTFISGFIVLYGARLAGGCTSGHMMSGMMQTAVAGYIFSAGAFLVGIPAARLLFQRESGS